MKAISTILTEQREQVLAQIGSLQNDVNNFTHILEVAQAKLDQALAELSEFDNDAKALPSKLQPAIGPTVEEVLTNISNGSKNV